MEKFATVIVVLALLLVAGAVIASADLLGTDSAEVNQVVEEPAVEPVKGCGAGTCNGGCDGTCGGSCGVKTCGCGR